MNQLLQDVLTNPNARSEGQIAVSAVTAADKYLPWSDEA